MNKKSKSRFSHNLTQRSLCALVIFSFLCSVLGFAAAYKEHLNLSVLSQKYQQAIEKVEACEESISELSEKIDSLQTQTLTEATSHSQNALIPDGDNPSDISPGNRQSDSSADATTAVADSKYYVTESGSKYHIGSCQYLSKSRIPISLDTIKAKGYTPCSRCIKH